MANEASVVGQWRPSVPGDVVRFGMANTRTKYAPMPYCEQAETWAIPPDLSAVLPVRENG
jgi:hypothetical protein